jgi:hypothetical protein
MLVMSGSLYVLGAALNLFNTVEWESLAVAGVALVGLAGVTALLGFMAPLIAAGSLALIGMSVALGTFAIGGVLFSSVAPQILVGLQGFAELDGAALLNTAGGLAGLAGSLYLLTPALLAVGAAGLFALPALMGLKALGINVLSSGGEVNATGGDSSQKQMATDLKAIKDGIDKLVTGFGQNVTSDGSYIDNMGRKMKTAVEGIVT